VDLLKIDSNDTWMAIQSQKDNLVESHHEEFHAE